LTTKLDHLETDQKAPLFQDRAWEVAYEARPYGDWLGSSAFWRLATGMEIGYGARLRVFG